MSITVDGVIKDPLGGSGGVPPTRKVNGHSLSSDITLDAGDVGAEKDAGLPASDGMVLSSTAGGLRSWIAPIGWGGVVIDLPFSNANENVAWEQTSGNWNYYADTRDQAGFRVYNPNHLVGDALSRTFQVPVTGTYSFYLLREKADLTSQWVLTLNGTQKGAIQDDYSVTPSYNEWTSIALGTLTAGTEYTLKIEVTGKNPSAVSPYYYKSLQQAILVQTS